MLTVQLTIMLTDQVNNHVNWSS